MVVASGGESGLHIFLGGFHQFRAIFPVCFIEEVHSSGILQLNWDQVPVLNCSVGEEISPMSVASDFEGLMRSELALNYIFRCSLLVLTFSEIYHHNVFRWPRNPNCRTGRQPPLTAASQRQSLERSGARPTDRLPAGHGGVGSQPGRCATAD